MSSKMKAQQEFFFARAAKPKRRVFKPIDLGSAFELPAAFSELDKLRMNKIQQGLGEILHKGIHQATFSEVFKRRDQVTEVLSLSGFEPVYDIENRRVQVREMLGDVEF